MDTLNYAVNAEAERSETQYSLEPHTENEYEHKEETESSTLSKYALKKLSRIEQVQNSKKVQNLKAVALEENKLHKKVSRNLVLSLRNTQCTVVCDISGVVSILNIPAIKGKALTYTSPIANISNARGIAQEGYDYLNALDTQILAGILIVISQEYDLFRTKPYATGAENNAILRTASKEKLILCILLIETLVNSLNFHYIPKLSLIYDDVLKESGIEGRITEWMKLLEASLETPDTEVYDENALLNKPMKSIADLKKEHREANKQAAKKPVDALTKQRAQFKKDIKEGKALAKTLENKKLSGFLSQIFTESMLLTVSPEMITKVIDKLAESPTATNARLIAILEADREALKKETLIDDLDDPLMISTESAEGGSKTDINQEEYPESNEISSTKPASYYNDTQEEEEEPISREEEILQIMAEDINKPKMPEGLSVVQRMLWKKRNGV